MFNKRLVEAMQQRRFSQSMLSRATGIGRNAISDYVKGKYEPKIDKVNLIASALDVDVSWLLQKSDVIDYRVLYEKEKLRADECCKVIDNLGRCVKLQEEKIYQLEKRWEKLKEHFNKEKEQSFSILSWSRNNGMLELMQQLEEDGE